MKITAVESIVAEIPFRHPFVVWRGAVKSKRHVFVRIVTDTGLVGVGEASPFLYYAPETAADVHSMMTDHIAPALIGCDALNVRGALDQFEVIDGHHFAKAAVETALWDLAGQAAGAPIYRLLGGSAESRVPIVIVLQTAEPAAMAAEAASWVGQGYRRLKIKIGFSLDADEAAVAAVREAVGPGPLIRVDAEERYALKDAAAIAQRLDRFGIELISQPVSRHDWDGMALLRQRLSMPLLADEGIATPEDVLRCVRAGAADMINIKVIKCGGLLPSLQMAAIARAANLPIVVGSMIESGIGSLFSAHFALAAPGAFSAEICGPLLFADDLLDRPLTIQDGDLILDGTPGLGAGLAADRLDRYRVLSDE